MINEKASSMEDRSTRILMSLLSVRSLSLLRAEILYSGAGVWILVVFSTCIREGTDIVIKYSPGDLHSFTAHPRQVTPLEGARSTTGVYLEVILDRCLEFARHIQRAFYETAGEELDSAEA